jgi:protein gp37
MGPPVAERPRGRAGGSPTVLAAVPAVVRFISYEPALGPLGPINLCGLLPDWVIAGGESGPGARKMNPKWARDARDDCRKLGIPFFMKQHGSYRSNPLTFEQGMSLRDAEAADPRSNGKGGALLDGRLYRQFPEPRRIAQRAIA